MMKGRQLHLLQMVFLFGTAIVLFWYAVNELMVGKYPRQEAAESNLKSEKCNSRFVFIDLGANRADSVRVFLKEPNTKFQYDFPKPPFPCKYSDAEIYLFEANPVFNSDLVKSKQQLMFERNPPAAKKIDLFTSTIVWIEDTTMPFFLDEVTVEHDFWASSVKDSGSPIIKSGKKSVNLTAIDIANFILKNFLPNDFVVVKMDIEGAEWDVVPHIVKMNAGINIDYLLIEWHWYHATEAQKNQHKQLVEGLQKQGAQLPEYDSLA